MNLNLAIVALIVVALAVLLLPSLSRPYLLVCLYAAASPVTWTMGDPSTTVVGRFAVADLVGFALLGAAFAHAALTRRRVVMSPQAMAAFGLVALLAPGLWVSRVPAQTLTEVLVLAFLAVIFFASENVPMRDAELKTILRVWIGATTAVCVLGMADYAHFVAGTPQLFERPEPQQFSVRAVATFRNTGQAGAYVMIVLMVALAYWSARGGFRWSKLWMPLAMTAMLLFLVLTVKRAAIVGTAIGVACWGAVVFVRQPRQAGILLVWGALLTAGLLFFLSSPQVTGRFLWKLQTMSRVMDPEQSGFVYQNWAEALDSFTSNPLLGRGYGGTDYVTDRYEVHSTYLKLLGEGGLLGVLGYVMFAGAALWYLRRADFGGGIWQRFLANLAPLLVGAVVSWMYIYHLRKREFWIMLLVIGAAARLAEQLRDEELSAVGPAPRQPPPSPEPTA